MLGVRQGGADVARRMCACLSASLAKTAWNMNHIRSTGGRASDGGTLTRPLGWKTSPSPRRQGAVLLPWCYVTAPARREYGWWYLQGMNQRWREGFITPQAAVTEGKSQLSSTNDMTTANDSNETVVFAIEIWEGFYLMTVNQLLITTILLLIYGCYLLLSSSFIGPPDSGQAPGDAVVTFQMMLVTQSKHNT